MKKFKNISEFEKLAKEQLNQHTVQPPSHVWSKVNPSSTAQFSAVNRIVSMLKKPVNLLKIAAFVSSSALIVSVVNQKSIKTKAEKVSINTKLPATPMPDIVEQKVGTGEDTPIKDKLPFSPDTVFNNSTQNLAENHAHSINENSAKPSLPKHTSIPSYSHDVSSHHASIEPPKAKDESNDTNAVMDVEKTDYKIITQKIDPQNYSFSTGNEQLIADWFCNDSLFAENQSTAHLTNVLPGYYTIKSILKNQKSVNVKTTTISIKGNGSIQFFNVFTPNGDGTNDEYGVDIKDYSTYMIQVFDQQTNQLIFESNDPTYKWNGKVHNHLQESPPGEYLARIYYKFIGEKPQIKSIKFTLIRP